MKGKRAKKDGLQVFVVMGMICVLIVLFIFFDRHYRFVDRLRPADAEQTTEESMQMYTEDPGYDYYEDERYMNDAYYDTETNIELQ